MNKYKNLKLNPNKLKNNVVFFRCLEKDCEKINSIFDSIFVTAKLFNYKIKVSKHSHYPDRIFVYFSCDNYWIGIIIFYEHYKIIGIDIKKKIKISFKWEIEQSFYHHNKFLCKSNKSQEELLREIFNFL